MPLDVSLDASLSSICIACHAQRATGWRAPTTAPDSRRIDAALPTLAYAVNRIEESVERAALDCYWLSLEIPRFFWQYFR
jgi:hypothetical protein